jgi:type IV pilus assembly protein PilV
MNGQGLGQRSERRRFRIGAGPAAIRAAPAAASSRVDRPAAAPVGSAAVWRAACGRLRFDNLPMPSLPSRTVRSRRAARAARIGAGGFSLLEVLIAIVILSFGVLGVVGLQAAALQSNKEARYQSTAVALGRELGDMMRGNKDVAVLAGALNPYLYVSGGGLPAAPEDCSTVSCSSAFVVGQFHLRDWLSRADSQLPGLRAVVCFDATPYASGVPQWGCSNSGGVVVLKVGWSRQSTDRSAAAASAVDRATRPAVVLPLIPGAP